MLAHVRHHRILAIAVASFISIALAAAGVYLCRLEAGDFTANRRLALVR